MPSFSVSPGNGLKSRRVLLVVTGGIAAVKAPDLVRRLRERGAAVTCVLTRAGAEFVTPMALAALSENEVYQDLFSLTDEQKMGHIRLARETDVVLVAPATADVMARVAEGRADDLAAAILLATHAPVVLAPAMNPAMWSNPATEANVATLGRRGVRFIGPDAGEMACGEEGTGRMTEPAAIAEWLDAFFRMRTRLSGRRALVTSGPTFEAVDPVRFIGNRSSGKQGHAIARALSFFGADTTLVTGPVSIPDPEGVAVVRVESARDMLAACEAALNEGAAFDAAVMAAAVADWRPATEAGQKIKKQGTGEDAPAIRLVPNPDILKAVAAMGDNGGNRRPRIVVGFAAETENLIENARKKLVAKGCDWIVANDVSAAAGTFGSNDTHVHLVARNGVEDWGRASKAAVGERLAARIADALDDTPRTAN